jgi:hypothetical protein
MVIVPKLGALCPPHTPPVNPNPQLHVKTYNYDGGLLNARAHTHPLSTQIFLINLGGVIWAVICTFLACWDSTFGRVSAGQTGCGRNRKLPPLYIVEGLFKAPPLYRLEAFQAESSSLRLGLRSERRVLARSLTHYIRFAPDEN